MDLNQAIYETGQLLTHLQYEQWLSILYSGKWWSLLILLIGSWVVWWKLVDKQRIFEVLVYALLVVIIGTTLNTYGVKLGTWSYPIKIFYLNPGFTPGDLALPPVLKSLVYQFCPRWKKFFLAELGVAAFLSFIGEPILVWMGAYKLYHWTYFYSFLVYMSVAVITKLIVDGIKHAANARINKSSPA